MITKHENRTIVDFKGDILVGSGIITDNDDKEVCVIMGGLNEVKGGIGEYYPEYTGKQSTDLINPIELYFSNPLSIDVVIEALQKAKDELITKTNDTNNDK